MVVNDTKTPASGHEPNVVSSRTIWWCGAALVAIILMAGVLMGLLSNYFARGVAGVADVEVTARVGPPAEAGSPVLIVNQEAALAQLRVKERAYLEQYAWVDRERGVARVPIGRAMEIISRSGLPKVVGETPVVEGQDR
ncbi:MAG: hypothetical protein WD669_07865 [Pirellulales bacterium]